MAHGVGHCHCLHTQLGYCQHCDVTYCYNCKREWGTRRWTYSAQLLPYTSYSLSAGSQTNATNILSSSTSEGGHTHG